MTLVDTSVWVDHFRRDNLKLRKLLEEGAVYTHPMVLGELACGNLPQRTRTLALLAFLPSLQPLSDEVVLQAVELRHLWGRGIGWTDAHLLCAAMIAGVPLWTLDRRLAAIAEQIRT